MVEETFHIAIAMDDEAIYTCQDLYSFNPSQKNEF